MAISGYNSVNISNNVPFNNDPGQVINQGDMLYWNTTYQAFEVGPGISKLSNLANDLGYMTEAEVIELIAGLQSGGTLDLSSYTTDAELQAAISGLSTFSGDYNDLTNKPALFSGNYYDLTNAPDLSNFVTPAQLNLAISNIDYTNFVTEAELSNALQNIDYTNFVTEAELSTALAGISSGGTIDLTGYVTNSQLASALANIDYSNFVTDAELANALQNVTQSTTDLTNYYNKTEVDNLIANIDASGSVDLTAYALKTDVFSGSYDDLTNKPFIPDLNGYATVSYVDLAIGNAVTNVTPDMSGYSTTTEMNTAIQTAVDAVPVFSGDYNDLINKPQIFSGSYLDLVDRPVLFSGDYNDLTNKPDHSVYASTTYVDTQIAASLSGGTIDLTSYVTDAELAAALSTISHPTTVSSFTNDIGYITNNDLTNALANYQPTIDLTAYYTKTEVDNLIANIDTSGTGTVDLTGYATETYVNQQISNAVLSAGGISNLNDLNDVAVGSLPQIDRADEFYLLEYNPVNQLWESRDFGQVFATQAYVSATVATALTDGTINLDGYATEQFVEQKLLEQGTHFSGDYNDLVNTPILFSGDYRDLINAPADNSDLRLVLDPNTEQLQLLNIEPEPDTIISAIDLADLGATLSQHIDYQQVNNLPNIFSGDYNDLINRPNLFSGNYNDLANKPYIPSIAGLASVQYVDNKWAEPVITGERTFTHGIVFEDFVQQKVSTVNAEAVKRDLVLAVQTINGIETEVLFSDSTRVAIATGTTAMFKATVVASSDTTKTAFTVRGVIDNTGTGISIIGNNIVETISDSDLGWTADFTADSINSSLKITVTGSPSTVVDWTVFLEISEVIR